MAGDTLPVRGAETDASHGTFEARRGIHGGVDMTTVVLILVALTLMGYLLAVVWGD